MLEHLLDSPAAHLSALSILIMALNKILLTLHTIGFFQLLGQILRWLTQSAMTTYQKIKQHIANTESYFKPTARQRRPIKEANKLAGWVLIVVFCIGVSAVLVQSLALALLALFHQNDNAMFISLIFLAFCFRFAKLTAAYAHQVAWQNGINIKLKRAK